MSAARATRPMFRARRGYRTARDERRRTKNERSKNSILALGFPSAGLHHEVSVMSSSMIEEKQTEQKLPPLGPVTFEEFLAWCDEDTHAIGDAPAFLDLANAAGLRVAPDRFTASLFLNVNRAGSPISIVIGAKKFNEGWNSYRVSCMGLLNVGRSIEE